MPLATTSQGFHGKMLPVARTFGDAAVDLDLSDLVDAKEALRDSSPQQPEGAVPLASRGQGPRLALWFALVLQPRGIEAVVRAERVGAGAAAHAGWRERRVAAEDRKQEAGMVGLVKSALWYFEVA